jgi:hypothetical protein
MASGSNVRTNVLLRSEQSGGHVSLMDNVVPARTPARPPPQRTTSTRRSTARRRADLAGRGRAVHQARGRARVRASRGRPRARQPQRRGRALSARLHAGRARAPLHAGRGRLGGRRAADSVGCMTAGRDMRPPGCAPTSIPSGMRTAGHESCGASASPTGAPSVTRRLTVRGRLAAVIATLAAVAAMIGGASKAQARGTARTTTSACGRTPTTRSRSPW